MSLQQLKNLILSDSLYREFAYFNNDYIHFTSMGKAKRIAVLWNSARKEHPGISLAALSPCFNISLATLYKYLGILKLPLNIQEGIEKGLNLTIAFEIYKQPKSDHQYLVEYSLKYKLSLKEFISEIVIWTNFSRSAQILIRSDNIIHPWIEYQYEKQKGEGKLENALSPNIALSELPSIDYRMHSKLKPSLSTDPRMLMVVENKLPILFLMKELDEITLDLVEIHFKISHDDAKYILDTLVDEKLIVFEPGIIDLCNDFYRKAGPHELEGISLPNQELYYSMEVGN